MFEFLLKYSFFRKRKYGTNQDMTVENSNDEEEEEEELLAAIEAEMGIDDNGEGTEQQEPPNKVKIVFYFEHLSLKNSCYF